MKINGRLLLILCAVALFIRSWNVNGQRPHAAVRTAAAIGSRSLAPTKKTPVPGLRQTAEQRLPSSKQASSSISGEERWTNKTVPFKLPEGLSAGDYRVVSDSGRVARLSVDGASRSAETSADFVAITVGTDRWYLVRLKAEAERGRPTDSTAWNRIMPSVPELPLSFPGSLANRKFDFTGYVQAATVVSRPAFEGATESALTATPAESLLQQAERPAPPELPSPL